MPHRKNAGRPHSSSCWQAGTHQPGASNRILPPCPKATVPEYGFLAFERQHRWQVDAPGLDPGLFDTEDEAKQTQLDWITTEELPQAIEKWEKDREAYFAECEVITQRVGSGFSARAEDWVRLPNGDQRPLNGRDPADVIEETRDASGVAYQEPTAPMLILSSKAKIRRLVVWQPELFLDGESRRLPPVKNWVYGLPIEAVLKELNNLSREGWCVAHSSEDKGLFSGETVGSDTSVTRVRYLLARPK